MACHWRRGKRTRDPAGFQQRSAWLRSQRVCVCVCYLQWVLGADGQDLVLEVAELAAPRASLTDPADEAGLMGAAHRAVTAAGAQ